MLAIRDPRGFTTTSTYDPAGRKATRQFANGEVTTYSYDRLNRMTGALYADGSRVTMGYDVTSNRIEPLAFRTRVGYDSEGAMSTSGSVGALACR